MAIWEGLQSRFVQGMTVVIILPFGLILQRHPVFRIYSSLLYIDYTECKIVTVMLCFQRKGLRRISTLHAFGFSTSQLLQL